MTTLPVWVKLPNLSLKCWSTTCLSKIASALGKPIQCDMLTSSMSRLSYARILVEINLAEDLSQFVKFCLPNGVMHAQSIVYETLPKFCAHCKVIGHIVDSCSKVLKKVGGGNSQVNATSVIRNSSPAEKDVLFSKGAVPLQNSVDLDASLVDVRLQDPMEVEASAFAHAQLPVPQKLSSNTQPDPMVSEAAPADHDWQPVRKKHTSNRQPKSGLGISASLALGKDSVASKDQTGEAARNESVNNGLMALGSIAAGSTMGKGCNGLNGKLIGAVPQVSAATNLSSGLRPVSAGVSGTKMVQQRFNSKKQPLKDLRQGGHTGKSLQLKSSFSSGHGRNLPTTTAL
ncbi:hypothetical protein OIU76_029989 [Salix suchowensis]|nr:hypothetical protein OIU76_029989 [Salix suchowensis]